MIVAHQGGPGREGRNESKTEIRQGLGNSTRPQLFCLWLRHLRDRGEILITKFPKFLEETKKEKEERGKKEKVEEKEEEKRILRNKKRIRVHEYLERTSFL